MSDFIVTRDPGHECRLPRVDQYQVGTEILCRANNGDVKCNKTWKLRYISFTRTLAWEMVPSTHYSW